ncbi:hypothetical protein BC829DRAFT_383863 [Chytridium lagenaria]|nr:hypothetical protein BC829DRAFT_383863 [Chytridium lagenaria]
MIAQQQQLMVRQQREQEQKVAELQRQQEVIPSQKRHQELTLQQQQREQEQIKAQQQQAQQQPQLTPQQREQKHRELQARIDAMVNNAVKEAASATQLKARNPVAIASSDNKASNKMESDDVKVYSMQVPFVSAMGGEKMESVQFSETTKRPAVPDPSKDHASQGPTPPQAPQVKIPALPVIAPVKPPVTISPVVPTKTSTLQIPRSFAKIVESPKLSTSEEPATFATSAPLVPSGRTITNAAGVAISVPPLPKVPVPAAPLLPFASKGIEVPAINKATEIPVATPKPADTSNTLPVRSAESSAPATPPLMTSELPQGHSDSGKKPSLLALLSAKTAALAKEKQQKALDKVIASPPKIIHTIDVDAWEAQPAKQPEPELSADLELQRQRERVLASRRARKQVEDAELVAQAAAQQHIAQIAEKLGQQKESPVVEAKSTLGIRKTGSPSITKSPNSLALLKKLKEDEERLLKETEELKKSALRQEEARQAQQRLEREMTQALMTSSPKQPPKVRFRPFISVVFSVAYIWTTSLAFTFSLTFFWCELYCVEL